MNDSDADMIFVLNYVVVINQLSSTHYTQAVSQDLTMELDTGAAVSVISEKTSTDFYQQLNYTPLHCY